MNQQNEMNKVSDLVFSVLAERQRHRQRTDLNNLFRQITRLEPNIDENAFYEVFKTLQDAKAGSLIIGRKGNPNRFIWKYNLKDIAEAAKTSGVKASSFENLDKITKRDNAEGNVKRSNKVIKAIRMKPGPKTKTKTVKPVSEVNKSPKGSFLQIDLSTMRPEDVKALVELVSKK